MPSACAASTNRRKSSGAPYRCVGANQFTPSYPQPNSPLNSATGITSMTVMPVSASCRQFADRRRPCSLARERTDVHLINDLAGQFHCPPTADRSSGTPRIHDLRRTVRTFGLKARCRIRECVPAIEKIPISHPSAGLGYNVPQK